MKATRTGEPAHSDAEAGKASRRAARRAGELAARGSGRAVSAWVRLMRIYHKVHQATVEPIRRLGLTSGQFEVLVQVGSAEGSTQQEVADALLVTKSNVCQLLDRMEEAGIVERRQHGRAKHLFLTRTGRQMFDEIVPEHERQIAELFSVLAPDEQRQLLQLLRTIDRALG